MKRAQLLAAFALLVFGPESAALAAGPDPAAEAARLVTQLDAPETRSIVQGPLNQSKAAQARARSARAAGDLQHATELDALALTWAQVADDLRRTAASEQQLAELQKSVVAIEQKALRTQALIEQTIARRARAEQNLKTLPTAPAHASPPKAGPPKASKEATLPVKAKASQPGVKK